MSNRDIAGTFVLFGGLGLLYFVFGTYGLGTAFLGMFLFWLTLGVSTGYWVGKGADVHVIELMKYLRDRGVIR